LNGIYPGQWGLLLGITNKFLDTLLTTVNQKTDKDALGVERRRRLLLRVTFSAPPLIYPIRDQGFTLKGFVEDIRGLLSCTWDKKLDRRLER
jgi:hypothetical protein